MTALWSNDTANFPGVQYNSFFCPFQPSYDPTDYEGLLTNRPCDRETVGVYVELMTEAACSSSGVRICGQDLSIAVVRSWFLKLERPDVEYVRDCLSHTASTIGNIKAYTLAALFNAQVTIEQYYAALVSREGRAY